MTEIKGTIEEQLKKENEECDEVEKKKLYPIARLFGQTEDELIREFKDYKAKKLFAKVEYDLTGVTGDEELGKKLEECVTYGFGGVIVLPQYISKAAERLKNKAEIVAAINFPYGEEIPYASLKCAKKAISEGADALLIPVGLTLVKRGDLDVLTKQFKKLCKAAANAKVYAALECGELTAEERKKIVESLIPVGVTAFVSATGIRKSDDIASAENLKLCVKNAKAIGYCGDEDFDKEIAVLSASDYLSTPSAGVFAKTLKIKLA